MQHLSHKLQFFRLLAYFIAQTIHARESRAPNIKNKTRCDEDMKKNAKREKRKKDNSRINLREKRSYIHYGVIVNIVWNILFDFVFQFGCAQKHERCAWQSLACMRNDTWYSMCAGKKRSRCVIWDKKQRFDVDGVHLDAKRIGIKSHFSHSAWKNQHSADFFIQGWFDTVGWCWRQ